VCRALKKWALLYTSLSSLWARVYLYSDSWSVDMWVLFVCRGDRWRRYWPPRSPWRQAGARTETSTRAGRELQKLSPRCLPRWQAGWLAGSEQAESISPAAASQSPRRAQNLAGTRAAYVTIFSSNLICICGTSLLFLPHVVSYQRCGESLK
jgi:hypothetical protein